MSRQPFPLLAGTSGATGTRKIAKDAQRIADLVFRAADRMRFRCVPRAIALRGMLARRGYDAELRLGILVRDGRVFGHAWVIVGETIVGESDELTTEFATLQPGALANYATRDGVHWLRQAPQESLALV